MKVPLKWLKDYVNISVPAVELARKLALAGLEVKEIQGGAGKWENIVVGQIVAINPHPNADRLRLPTVDLSAEKQTVVCGAPNIEVGQKIAFARVGAELIDGHTGERGKLKPAKIRGVESRGMVCSEKELGLSGNHEGILVLPPDAPVGMPLADYLGDVVFDLEVTPNRPDCLSVIGLAREAAALTGQKLSLPDVSYAETGSPIGQQVTVEIVDADLCPRYCASLISGVKIGASPRWLQDRLLACGMRPINNVVDITNYVMLEYGQPLHAFDYDKITARKIIVRRARDNEVLISLDGEERKLAPDMLVIADERRAVALAGVMGGANSEVTGGTASILLEAASFKPASIHYTSRQLGLLSEASARFERGIRAELAVPALRRASQLMTQLADGKAAAGIIDVYPGKKESEPIRLSPERANWLLGTGFSHEQITSALTALGFECQPAAKGFLVSVPWWRSDIRLEEDLIEEAARIIGYDQIPLTMLSQPIPRQDPAPIIGLKRKIRDKLSAYGFQEVITYSLTSLENLQKVQPEQNFQATTLRLVNPMTADMEYLRPNLRANLLNVLLANRRHETGGIKLFELGRVYVPRPKDLPDERETLCGILSGPRSGEWWQNSHESQDFFEAKGVVEGLLAQFGIRASFAPGNDPALHPIKQAVVNIGDSKVGALGEMHPKVLHAFEISEPVLLFEINVAALLPHLALKLFEPLPHFPSVVRDIALVIDIDVTHQRVVDIIASFTLVKDVTLFDVYSGEQVPAGKKSLAYHITYQSPEHTLTDEEVNQVQEQVVSRLAKELGATLRR